MIGYFFAGTKLILDETEPNTFHQILNNPMNGTKYHSIQFFFTQFHPFPSMYTYPPTSSVGRRKT